MGRPSGFTEEIADVICERLAGGESLRAICRDDGMPSTSMVFRWLSEFSSFRDRYARAREAQADALFDEILEIADETAFDTEITESGSRPNSEWIARSRLRVDARKWMASKLAPKKYGEKLELAGDQSAPLTVVVRKLTGD
ncbi:TPA: terminase small subunit protein [Burkholderia vietnamiensis]|nr:terminase small subunit protein [Burkholderia vietnamiensis]